MLLHMTFQKNMKLMNEIDDFLDSKNFSQNTKSNYYYDLIAFTHFFENKKLSETGLELYRASLVNAAISAQRRKISSINQFLLYLYNQKKIDHFYHLEQVSYPKSQPQKASHPMYKEFPEFYKDLQSPGQFLALLILEFGLNFSEIQQLEWRNFNWNFKILSIEKKGMTRVLPIREKFALRVRGITNADELFGKTRQFLYLELKKYTTYSSKELREQYILRQIRSGKTIYEVAGMLGLSTIITLEKYYR